MRDAQQKIIREDMDRIYRVFTDYQLLEGKSVLITGATGMLSFYIVRFFAFLNEMGIHVNIYALVRNQIKAHDKYEDIENKEYFRYIVGDVCDEIKIKENIDYIFHMAGNASPSAIRSNPVDIIRTNTIGTINVSEFARKNKGCKVFFASTREVYGKTDSQADIKEGDMGITDCLEDRACYPESKRMAENILKSYSRQYGIKYVIGRIAHVYGPEMNIVDDGRIMSDLISDVAYKRSIKLKSDGMMERAFCYLSDAVAAIILVTMKTENEVFNIANESEPVKIRELATMLTKLYNERSREVIFDIPKQRDKAYSKAGRIKLNLSKIKGLGFKPLISLEEGIKRTVDYNIL